MVISTTLTPNWHVIRGEAHQNASRGRLTLCGSERGSFIETSWGAPFKKSSKGGLLTAASLPELNLNHVWKEKYHRPDDRGGGCRRSAVFLTEADAARSSNAWAQTTGCWWTEQGTVFKHPVTDPPFPARNILCLHESSSFVLTLSEPKAPRHQQAIFFWICVCFLDYTSNPSPFMSPSQDTAFSINEF